MVEDLGLARSGRRDKVLVKNIKNVLADLGKLSLNLLPVGLDHGDLSLVTLGLLLLFDGGDDSPGSSAGTDNVLVGDGEEITLLDGELLVGRGDRLHVLDHFYTSRQCVEIKCRKVIKTYPRIVQPARRAWQGRQSLLG